MSQRIFKRRGNPDDPEEIDPKKPAEELFPLNEEPLKTEPEPTADPSKPKIGSMPQPKETSDVGSGASVEAKSSTQQHSAQKANVTFQQADAYQSSYFPTWCPGCGNFSMWTAFKHAAAELKLDPEQTLIVHGIGCAGNGSNFFKAYEFHGLHGRALPVATGARLANPTIKTVVMGGDGDMYGIGLSHLVHAMRRNLNLTTIIHNNQIYALTVGQASPTSDQGFTSKSTPEGVIEEPVNPISLALASGATFVARAFSGDLLYTREIYKQALQHKGFAIIDVFQPCVTFNKINTYQWFRDHVYKLEEDASYDRTNKSQALAKAFETDRLPVGIFYTELRKTYEDDVVSNKTKPIAHQDISNVSVASLMESFC